MRRVLIVMVLGAAVVLPARSGHAEPGTDEGEVCVAIDEARDSLSALDRASAVMLLERQFELEGRRIAPAGCANEYLLSHIALGGYIVVRLAGPVESREGVAAELRDLSAVYSQMVRSIVTGKPMAGFNVIDRSNVTIAQSQANRVHSDRYAYARVGFGAIAGDGVRRTPAMGFGYRAELDALALDVSIFNVQTTGAGYVGAHAGAFSLVRLQALYFVNPTANASTYVGGGLSWGATSFDTRNPASEPDSYRSGWHGSGLQGELTVGYELPRASTIRIFVEGTATLPFYRVASARYSSVSFGSPDDVSRRYAPAFVASIGFGWQRDGSGGRTSPRPRSRPRVNRRPAPRQ